MEKVKKQRYKIFCPKCGHRLFRGSSFDLEMDCPNCGSNIDLEREDVGIRIVLEVHQVPEG
ncbi:hypothetical protein D6853_09080 [Butyrivibrio sp. X503]|uniref:hypothetical protein n=1 Tax=unclassified Butyrivibrio TaxID=2639466 RepID=UPI000EA9D7B2|nr:MULTISPECIES: hypothetical protein [unclassified Butyrivibrio]RKM55697.1 hypothetical protein D6853_09080 [Butyrivibrio sp. X503]RKM63003.1 hypothetical protein D6856_02450 [Butyrivibrio sp. XB500-5]